MTVSEALEFFKGLRDVQLGLAPLEDVGLEYVKLGQPVPTLSGGEAQRLKLAGHLAEAARSGIQPPNLPRKAVCFYSMSRPPVCTLTMSRA
jgi:excinuclease ABC subunit A